MAAPASRPRWWALHVTRPEGRRVELSLLATTAIEAERVGARLVRVDPDVCLAFVILPAPCSPHRRVYSDHLQPGPPALLRWICHTCGARGLDVPTVGTVYEPDELAFRMLGGEQLAPPDEPTPAQVAEAAETPRTHGERIRQAVSRIVNRGRVNRHPLCLCGDRRLDGKETCGRWECVSARSRWPKGRKVGGR